VPLFLRIFADCDSAEFAHGVADRLRLALSAFSPQDASQPQQYWKIHELFEFTFCLSPATEQSFQALISIAAGGWSHEGSDLDRSSIWNRKLDHVFLVPEVRWAEAQLYDAAP